MAQYSEATQRHASYYLVTQNIVFSTLHTTEWSRRLARALFTSIESLIRSLALQRRKATTTKTQ